MRRRLRADESLTTYRVELSWAGPDPRVALRSDAELSDEDVAAIDVRLERLDRASSHGPWTMAVLDVIRRRPATRAADLAEPRSSGGSATRSRSTFASSRTSG